MSDNPAHPRDGVALGAARLLADAAAADSRARDRLKAAIGDFFLPEDARLDERTRAALGELLGMIAGGVERALRDHAARLLAGRHEPALALAMASGDEPVLARLARANLLGDTELMAALLRRVREVVLAEALAAGRDDSEPGPVDRLARHADPVVAASARALLAAQGARAAPDLPPELHGRLVWLMAAGLRDQLARALGEAHFEVDCALNDAALRAIAAHGESERVEAAAMRLASALDPDARAELMIAAIEAGQPTLFVALIAHGLELDYRTAAEVLLDPEGERLWLALRALDLPSEAIARIGYLLCQSDPRRDVERLADTLAAVAAVTGAEARATLAPLRLDSAYRAAVDALREAAA